MMLIHHVNEKARKKLLGFFLLGRHYRSIVIKKNIPMKYDNETFQRCFSLKCVSKGFPRRMKKEKTKQKAHSGTEYKRSKKIK